jgi:hypothetical protein
MTDIIERLSALSAVSTDSSTILTEVKAGIINDAIAEITRLRAELAHAQAGTGPYGPTFADIKRDIRAGPIDAVAGGERK